jgi:hypothetical protein
MFEQKYYREMKVGEVYRCPPGGQVVLVVNNEHFADTGYVTFLVMEAGGNVNWRGKDGMTVREQYTHWSMGSWTRVS